MRQPTLGAAVGLLQLVVFVFGCGPSHVPRDSAFTVAAVVSDLTPERLRDGLRTGVDLAASELDADAEWRPVEDAVSGREMLTALGEERVDLVFVADHGFEQWVATRAQAYPETVYVVVPGRLRDANVGSIRFVAEEAGYVAGSAAAALAVEDLVGVLRGQGQPWLDALEEGFVAGFSARRPRVSVEIAASNDDLAKLVAGGVEIALYATDRADPVILESAAAAGLRLIVTEPALISSHPAVAIAAIDVDLPEAMVRVAREVRDGVFAGRVFSYDLGSGVLDVTISRTLPVEARQRARDALEAARSEVTAGLVEFDEFGL